jgi:hypothetical protein
VRNTIIVILSVLVVGLVSVPNGVSAERLSIEVEDRVGDLAAAYDSDTWDVSVVYGENTLFARNEYFDMTLFEFSLTGNTYTYAMELAADLPKEGDPLPTTISLVQYMLWFDKDSWDWVEPALTLFMVVLQYDGSAYSAALLDYPSWEVIMPLEFTIDGARFEVKFSAGAIDDLSTFWLYPSVLAYTGGSGFYHWLDIADPNAAPGMEYNSIPWPPQ